MIWWRKKDAKPIIIDVFIDPSRAIVSLKELSRWEHIEKFTRDYWMPMLAPLIMIVGIIYYFSASAGTINIYSASCLGDWEAVGNAQGEPNLKPDATSADFSLDNSAVWRGGTKQIFCGGFKKGDSDTELKGAHLKFSWVTKVKEPPPVSPQGGGEPLPEPVPEINTEEPTSVEVFEPVPEETPTPEPPVETPTPEPLVETPTPEPPVEIPVPPAETPALPVETPAPQSFLQKILLTAFAQEETASSSEVASSSPEVIPEVISENIVATDDLLEVMYTLDGENWISLGKVRADSLRDATFDIPLTDWFQLEHLQVSVRGTLNIDESPDVYLDAMWLDVDWEKIKQNEEEEKLKGDKNNGHDFKAGDNAELDIDLNDPGELVPESDVKQEVAPESEPTSFLKRFINVVWAEGPDLVVDKIVDPKNNEINLNTRVDDAGWGKRRIVIERPEREFHPGKYSVKFTVKNKQYKQDFTWGVLAINTNKSIYLSGETAKIGMGLLDDFGRTKCLTGDSPFEMGKLWLTITAPDGAVSEFSTEDGTILGSDTCAEHSVTNDADFQTSFTTAGPGMYQMHLEGENQNGRRSIDDQFQVAASPDDVPFDVERTSDATRIYPGADYTNTITINSRVAYSGPIEEYVPASFVVSNISGGGHVEEGEKFNKIVWDANLASGGTLVLSYTYDPPNISPEFYLLGPLTFNVTVGGFKEARQWQIASDATVTWDGGCTGGSGPLFSCDNNWSSNGDPASTDDLVFDGTSTDAATWDTGAGVQSTYNSITLTSAYTGVFTITNTPVTITGALNDQHGTNGTTFTGSLALSIGGALTLLPGGGVTANTSTVTLTGTANLNTTATLNNLTINGSGTTISTVTSNFTVSGTLTIGGTADGDNDTLSIGTGRSVTSNSTGTITIVGSGTDAISGAGTLIVQNSNLSANGTVDVSTVRYNTTGTTMTARTYGGNVTVTTTSGAVTVTAAAGTINITGNLTLTAISTGVPTLDANTNDPAINVTGDLIMNNIVSGSPVYSATSATTTITGNFTKSAGTFTHNNGEIRFVGTGTSTLAYDADITFYDFKVASSSKRMAFDETQRTTVANNFTINGGACGTEIRLWSSTTNNDWPITVSGTASVNYADIMDSTANSTYTANSSINSGGNTLWTINGCTSLTFSIDNSTVAFGTVTPGTYKIATSTLSINTNNSTGYYVVLYGNDRVTGDTVMDLTTDASVGITDDTEWIPGVATTSAGNAALINSTDNVLAFRVMTASGSPAFRASTWWGTSDDNFNSLQLWAGFASSTLNRQIGNSSVPTSGTELISIQYFLNVPATQLAGDYTGPITFAATTNP